MKFAIRLFFFLFELIAFFIGLLIFLGVVSSDPIPNYLLFWNCGSWTWCLYGSLYTYVPILFVPLIVIHWFISFKKWKKNRKKSTV